MFFCCHYSVGWNIVIRDRLDHVIKAHGCMFWHIGLWTKLRHLFERHFQIPFLENLFCLLKHGLIYDTSWDLLKYSIKYHGVYWYIQSNIMGSIDIFNQPSPPHSLLQKGLEIEWRISIHFDILLECSVHVMKWKADQRASMIPTSIQSPHYHVLNMITSIPPLTYQVVYPC